VYVVSLYIIPNEHAPPTSCQKTTLLHSAFFQRKISQARSETVDEKPSFKNAFAKRRCIILADGFYEWQKTEKTKQPWYFKLPSGNLFGFAGLWEVWKNSEGQKYNSCTILTTIDNELVKHVHDRMPVILRPNTINDWLNPDTHDIDQLKEILSDGKVKNLKGYPVTNKINLPSNNDPSCIEPLITYQDSGLWTN